MSYYNIEEIRTKKRTLLSSLINANYKVNCNDFF